MTLPYSYGHILYGKHHRKVTAITYGTLRIVYGRTVLYGTVRFWPNSYGLRSIPTYMYGTKAAGPILLKD